MKNIILILFVIHSFFSFSQNICHNDILNEEKKMRKMKLIFS